MRTWFQVYMPIQDVLTKVFGFCIKEDIVVDLPYEYSKYLHYRITNPEFRKWLLYSNSQVIKIADVHC